MRLMELRMNLGASNSSNTIRNQGLLNDGMEKMLAGTYDRAGIPPALFGNGTTARKGETTKWDRALREIIVQYRKDNPDCKAGMESNLLPRPYPNEDAQVTRHRSALNARIRTGMAAAGYPRMMSLFRNIWRAYDVCGVAGHYSELDAVDEYWILRIVKKYGIDPTTYAYAAEKIQQPYEAVTRYFHERKPSDITSRARALDVSLPEPICEGERVPLAVAPERLLSDDENENENELHRGNKRHEQRESIGRLNNTSLP